jgi:hypothetical protein
LDHGDERFLWVYYNTRKFAPVQIMDPGE